MEDFVIGLGYGGELEAMAKFEWDFRCQLGLRESGDDRAREAFIKDFSTATTPDEPVVLLLDEYDNPLFRTFMELGKQAIAKYPGLHVFVLAEDRREVPSVQYLLNIEPDPIDERLYPYQMMIDAVDVPDDVFRFIQSNLDVQFYRREDDIMLEFRIQELPVVKD